MDREKKILLQYSLAGAIVGYCIFHPAIMVLSYLMSVKDTALNLIDFTSIMAVVLRSFSMDMLPWSLSFAFFNGIIGLYYGGAKVEKLAREKLITDLRKALADVKTLRGMLPLCAWCKKIRNDEGYWQGIDAYIRSHTDIDFTHGICNECAKKEFPEIYSDLEKESSNGR